MDETELEKLARLSGKAASKTLGARTHSYFQ